MRPNSLNQCFIMSVDVDGWPSLLGYYGVAHDKLEADAQVKIDIGVERLLKLFELHNVYATFFVTGEMASMHPYVVRIIHDNGHEIACHGLYHEKNECLLKREEQEYRIKKATNIIQRIINEQPLGFRAPCLNISAETFKILYKNRYLYDSSVISTFIPGYYKYLNFKLRPYHAYPPQVLRGKGKFRTLWEIPVAVNPFLHVPLSAAWMRNLGVNWVKLGIKLNFTLGVPLMFYVHPRDVLPLPKIKGVPWHVYRNVGFKTVAMLDKIIKYVKNLKGSFLRAIDVARSLEERERTWD